MSAGSAHFAQCLRYQLHPKADLVLLEFSVNDGHNNAGSMSSVEGIVRRISAERGGFAARPAIAFVNWWDHWPGRNDNVERTRDGAPAQAHSARYACAARCTAARYNPGVAGTSLPA